MRVQARFGVQTLGNGVQQVAQQPEIVAAQLEGATDVPQSVLAVAFQGQGEQRAPSRSNTFATDILVFSRIRSSRV